MKNDAPKTLQYTGQVSAVGRRWMEREDGDGIRPTSPDSGGLAGRIRGPVTAEWDAGSARSRSGRRGDSRQRLAAAPEDCGSGGDGEAAAGVRQRRRAERPRSHHENPSAQPGRRSSAVVVEGNTRPAGVGSSQEKVKPGVREAGFFSSLSGSLHGWTANGWRELTACAEKSGTGKAGGERSWLQEDWQRVQVHWSEDHCSERNCAIPEPGR